MGGRVEDKVALAVLDSIRSKFRFRSALSFDSLRALFLLEDRANPKALGRVQVREGPSNVIVESNLMTSQLKANAEILKLINHMAGNAKSVNINELRALLQSTDAENTGETIFSVLLSYVVDKQSMVMTAFDVEGEFIVNYNDVLCSSMALHQFVVHERRAELFSQISKQTPIIKKEDIKRLLVIIGQGVYTETDDDLTGFIQGHHINSRSEPNLTFREFVAMARNLNLEVTEDLLLNKELINM
eukprot:TRINITY_DN326_c0_g2_i1.p1 TRINITY_DN326_c0_g2~~TRINITY_DN326_c0_g2_i1.p1  ORF type:complete len:244 (+),score=33.23 TRINITY_DN326_c0_g2_i1:163-894(+)